MANFSTLPDLQQSNQRVVFIVNPNAANGTAKSVWATQIEPLVSEWFSNYHVHFTAHKGDGTVQTERFVQEGKWDVICAVGGDGTNNEVINGYMKANGAAKGVALATVPMGTGGDFVRTFHMTDWRRALEVLRDGCVHLIDAGQVEFARRDGGSGSSFFLNEASCGISGVVCEFVNGNHSKSFKSFGRIGFLVGYYRAVLGYNNAHMRYCLDDGEWKQNHILQLVMSNGKYYGGAMVIAPDAQLDDGQFDVICMGDVPKLKQDSIIKRIYTGDHVNLDPAMVSVSRARVVQVESLQTTPFVPLEIEGETPDAVLPAKFTILPKAVKLVVPSASKRSKFEEERLALLDSKRNKGRYLKLFLKVLLIALITLIPVALIVATKLYFL